MEYPQAPDPNKDAEHLRLLTLFYYIQAGLCAVIASVLMIYVAFLVVFAHLPLTSTTGTGPPQPGPPAIIFYAMAGIFFFFVVLGWIFAFATFHTGRSIAKRENYTFIQVMAALHCLHAPYGTALGVFTFIVLGRPSVKLMFQQPSVFVDGNNQ